MTTYLQDPERLDSNVTIKVPERIVVEYKYPDGWYIQMDGIVHHNDGVAIYFDDVSDATDWLVERDLIKTTAYAELHKKVKKVAKKKAKEKAA